MVRRRTLSLLFFLRKGKDSENERIYLRITVDGLRTEVSINRTIDPSHWNQAKGCAKNNSPVGKEINSRLDQIRNQIYQNERELIDRNRQVTAQSLKESFLQINDESNRLILQVYQEHNDNLKLLLNNGIAPGTYERHVTSRNHLESFILTKFGLHDYPLKNIDHYFIKEYEVYLKTVKKCCNNTTVKYIRNFGKIIRYALNNDWIRLNPFRNIRYRLDEVDKPFLNHVELDLIIKKPISIKRIAQVRDVFVFCCFTGLAFVDVKSLTKKDLEVGFDGKIWIKKQRHKSKQLQQVPLLPIASQIIQRYSTDPDCITKGVLLPVLTNQKMNAYLKEVADICGIDKNLTTHCARHTFATTVALANGISIESTSKMLGHSNIRMTQKYARILDSTIGQEMNQLAGKLNFQLN